jgi:hypothetical protein
MPVDEAIRILEQGGLVIAFRYNYKIVGGTAILPNDSENEAVRQIKQIVGEFYIQHYQRWLAYIYPEAILRISDEIEVVAQAVVDYYHSRADIFPLFYALQENGFYCEVSNPSELHIYKTQKKPDENFWRFITAKSHLIDPIPQFIIQVAENAYIINGQQFSSYKPLLDYLIG